MNTGKAIKKALIDADMTQAELAHKLEMTRVNMNNICNNKLKGVDLVLLESIADVLGLDVMDLLKSASECE